MNITSEAVLEKGFLDINIDPHLDLFAEIERLKKEIEVSLESLRSSANLTGRRSS